MSHECEASEDFQTLLQVVPIEDKSCQPVSTIFLEDLLMDSWVNLDLAVTGRRQATSIEEVCAGS